METLSKAKLFSAVLVVAVLFIDRALGGCTVNVSPCTCTNTTGVNNTFSININCQNVPVTTVKTVFSGALPYNISQVTIIPNVNDTQIISNITGNHSITTLVLDCSYMANKSLNVNSSAFTLSKLGTTNITIQKCDLSRLSYSFLTGFTNLTTFYIYNSSNFHTTFYTLPSSSLGKLKNFWLNQVKGINGFSNSSFKYPKSIYVATNYASAPITSVLIGNTGTGLNCTDCKIGDTALNSLLKNWIQPSSSMLDSLQLMGNNLTTIPSYVNKYFVYLTVIDFSRNQQPLNIPTNAFYANRPIKTMDFRYSIISNIGDNAFQGSSSNIYSYQYAQVYLSNNNLTTFPKNVFYFILSRMSFMVGGRLYTVGNNFDCSVNQQCNLKWLIKDNPTYLNCMPSATCSNGTNFKDLNPNTLRGPNNTKCN